MTLRQLDTPCLLVDVDRVQRNLAAVAESATAAGVALRPHATHHSARLARRQVELGACGLACATAGEAEALVDAGIRDVFVTGPVVGAPAVARLAGLARTARLRVGADSVHAARPVAAAAQDAGVRVGIAVEVAGAGYRGVPAAAVPDLAREVLALPGARFDGVFGDAAGPLGTVAARLRRLGIDCPSVSLDSVPPDARDRGVTEARAGDHVFGTAGTDPAATVAARVLGRPDFGVALVDAGRTALAGTGVAVRDHPDSRILELGEHHGVLALDGSLRDLRIGDVVELVPDSAGTVAHNYAQTILVTGGEPNGTLPLDARGRP